MIIQQVIKYANANYLEATWVDQNDIPVKCRAYAGEQMDELEADLGADAATYATLIAECRAAVVPYVPPPPVIPREVSRFQAKAALLQAGLLDTVEAIMGNPATPTIAKLAWKEALSFERQSPTVLMLAGALQLTSKQLDDLFITASSITA
jgi:hypothetical protein